jgi:hypothetical protein
MISLRGSLARIEHGQTNQKLTIRARGYNKKKNALIRRGGVSGNKAFRERSYGADKKH